MTAALSILERLAEGAEQEQLIEAERIELMTRARMLGISWQAIADALGIAHRQQVAAKYSEKVRARTLELMEQLP